MKIENANFFGGQHQFGTNINNFNFSLRTANLWSKIPKENLSSNELIQLEQQIAIINQEDARAVDKFDAITRIFNIVAQQSDGSLPEQLYSTLFRDKQGESIRFDAFLSFAEEDVEIAEKVYSELTKNGLNVWFSREHLKYGQSILGIITKVIQNSSSGIVVLSESTFSDERHFPIQELTALYNQNIYRKLLLFPIYHGISHGYILDHYPMLSDLYACNTKQGVEAIVKEFVQQLRKHQKKIR
ncbi:MAG: toll/interleukin-1 receptor domain-containing protein [Bacteroidota bacterium]